MSVVLLERAKPKLYPRVDDPTYPCGEWAGAGRAVGDLTGGYACVRFNVGATLASRYCWSWEGWATHEDTGVAHDYTLEWVTGENYRDTGAYLNAPTFWVRGSMTTGTGAAGLIVPMLERYHPRPFNYVCKPDVSYDMHIGIYHEVNTNGMQYWAFAWGYIWLPAAKEQGPGPRRPT